MQKWYQFNGHFALLGSTSIKATSKHVGEIDLSLPYLTIIDYYPALYVICEPFATDDKPSNYQVLNP